ncbi:MAG TPA: DNA recombination protein RmuC [Candidatus Krumholzibacteria bacterium]
MNVVLMFVAGAALGGLLMWLVARARTARLETTIEQERRGSADRIAALEQSEARLSDTFKALSGDALKSNNEAFLQLARATLEKYQDGAKNDLDQKRKDVETLVKPIADTLEKVNTQIVELEKTRRQDYGSLAENLRSLQLQAEALNAETRNLGNALRKPMVRGRWGEIQLERVVELAGMMDHVDFHRQASTETEDGRLRPDLVVRLPGGKTIVVDAKAPIESYLAAHEEKDELRAKELMKQHARAVKAHVSKLSEKAYWSQFVENPEFVVLFLPGENFFSAALENEPALIEEGVKDQIIIATPSTLIALLKAVAFGWRQEKIAESAQEIKDLGKELYKRLSTLADHFGKVGLNLDRAIGAYNDAVGSLETRVLPAARRFQELEVATVEEIDEVKPIEKSTRALQAAEFIEAPAAPPPARPAAGSAQVSIFDAAPAASRPGLPSTAGKAPVDGAPEIR